MTRKGLGKGEIQTSNILTKQLRITWSNIQKNLMTRYTD